MDKDSMRVQITMPVDLVDEIDKQASKINLSRSSFITMVVSQYSEQKKVMESFRTLAKILENEDAEKQDKLMKILNDIDNTEM